MRTAEKIVHIKEEGNPTTKVEIKVMRPETKECWKLPEAGRCKNKSSLEPPERTYPCPAFDFWLSEINFEALASRTEKLKLCCFEPSKQL